MGRLDHWNIKTKAFGLAKSTIRKVTKLIQKDKIWVYYSLHKQLIRSISGIWANVAEADMAISKKEFRRILVIALREMNESLYWMKLLKTTQKTERFEEEMNLLDELIRITCTIVNKLSL